MIKSKTKIEKILETSPILGKNTKRIPFIEKIKKSRAIIEKLEKSIEKLGISKEKPVSEKSKSNIESICI